MMLLLGVTFLVVVLLIGIDFVCFINWFIFALYRLNLMESVLP